MIRNYLPGFLGNPLWGDRKQFGLVIRETDGCWLKWQKSYLAFYGDTQRKGVGVNINDAGYNVVSCLDMKNKVVLEIGPGDIRHVRFWKNRPEKFILADVQQAMLDNASAVLNAENIPTECLLMHRGDKLPLPDSSVDIALSFYSMEHIYPLSPYLKEIYRVLKPGGVLAGAIPAEGGLAWGGGRFVTSRRWFKKNTTINPDKIICWEHPNFGDQIVNTLDRIFTRKKLMYWPLPWIPLLDCNLIIRFVYEKPISDSD